ncbi:MAG: hypothetical protein NDI61_01540 [Bdellovibrionaceae bacterium]|nr:hypothetical protein [Pseudobdellovibrionaceae bacterium]
MLNSRSVIIGLAVTSALLVGACTKKVVVPVTSAAPIASYCTTPQTFTSPVTITGSAKYEFRENGNGAVSGTPGNIRFAEVVVTDSAGTIVQCTETDSSGNFSFDLSANSGTYTVKVNSRANNSNLKAYVMNNPTDNTYYSVATTVSSASSGSISLTASATGAVIAGAFNILDKLADANVFLRTQASAGACTTFTDCNAFTVAPIVYVYWTKGFNPNVYLGGSATSGVSFFLKGTNELYILGGIEGDVDSSDCDHFDNSIILHEYGHFIEGNYSGTDSPGGRHAPNETLDPRLSWSEGFANFFQAAVTGVPLYRDTEGNVSCGSGCTQPFHDENLEAYENYDNPALIALGQGNFHEFSVTRALWDALDPHPVSGAGGGASPDEAVTSPFAEIWTVFTGTSYGFASSGARFRNIGLFFKTQSALGGSQDWSSIRTLEMQRGTQQDFATPLVQNTCGATTISPFNSTNTTFAESHLFYDNDFYAHYHASGTLNVRVAYASDATPINVDLIVWKNGYRYGTLTDALASSQQSRTTDGGDEEISISATAGWYMINVMAFPNSVATPGSATYTLYINGSQYCASLNP